MHGLHRTHIADLFRESGQGHLDWEEVLFVGNRSMKKVGVFGDAGPELVIMCRGQGGSAQV